MGYNGIFFLIKNAIKHYIKENPICFDSSRND